MLFWVVFAWVPLCVCVYRGVRAAVVAVGGVSACLRSTVGFEVSSGVESCGVAVFIGVGAVVVLAGAVVLLAFEASAACGAGVAFVTTVGGEFGEEVGGVEDLEGCLSGAFVGAFVGTFVGGDGRCWFGKVGP